MIPISEQYRINIKNAIELIDNTLKLVERSNVVLSSKHLREIRKEISKKPYYQVSEADSYWEKWKKMTSEFFKPESILVQSDMLLR